MQHRPGDRLLPGRVLQYRAEDAGMAPNVSLGSTHMRTLEWVTLDDLRRHAAE